VNADGFAKNEGDVEVGGFPPYPISYRAIVPRREESTNLMVPVCLSASHMAFGSIRMEPVFMVLGQSAATAACLALDAAVSIQDVPYETLKERLERDGQILNYGASYQQSQLDGIIVDDTKAILSGNWKQSTLLAGYRMGYKHDGDARDGKSSATFAAKLPKPGKYEVQIAWTSNPNRATNVPVLIKHAQGIERFVLNQREDPNLDIGFHRLGMFPCGRNAEVIISNKGTNGHVIIDAVRWVEVVE